MMQPSSIMQSLSYLFKPIYGGIGQILMFHRVCQQAVKNPGGGAQLEVSTETLEMVISFFRKKGYAFISLDELYDNLLSRHPSKKIVVFTFDDGYIDNFTIAYPALKAENIPFTVYIATSFPDRTARLWWYALDELFLANPWLEIETDRTLQSFDCSNEGGRREASIFIRSKLKSATPASINSMIRGIFTNNKVDLEPLVNSLAMSWQQIEKLSKDPLVTIGAHTTDHFVLNRLNDKDLRDQIQLSRKSLTDHLGISIDHFAYPYGSRNEAGEREFQLVRELGFKTGVTSRFASIFSQHREHLECLPRIEVPAVPNAGMLELAVNGIIQARRNRFKRVVTL